MKRIFISHPYAGDPVKNMESVNKICKELNKQNDVLPISPLHLFGFMDTDKKREAILLMCFDLISICDEVWVYGDSLGCMLESEHAKYIGKKVVVM